MQHELLNVKGVVVALLANYLVVEIDLSNNQIINLNMQNSGLQVIRLLCTTRSRLHYHGFFANVGDQVFLDAIDLGKRRAVITEVLVRNSWIDRPPVANATDIFVVLSILEPSFDVDQANRFLMMAEQTGLKVNLILTKLDLISDKIFNQFNMRLTGWGYEPIAISLQNGRGISKLLEKLKDSQLAILSGPSGVGKSSLVNYLVPNASVRVGDLSRKLRRGVNTTRHVELFSVSSGSFVADTPGYNRPEFQVEADTLQLLFPELREQLLDKSCKFRNCLHRDEPGCQIDKNWERYVYYRDFIEAII